MANNLKDHLKEVADAIRAKKGTTDLINPQDFATEIEGITSGSGGESGDWELTYYKIVNADEQMMQGLFLYGGTNIVNCAVTQSNNKVMVNAGNHVAFTAINDGRSNEIVAIVSAKVPILVDGEYKPTSLKELFISSEIWDSVSPMLLEITKEEYYDLNA